MIPIYDEAVRDWWQNLRAIDRQRIFQNTLAKPELIRSAWTRLPARERDKIRQVYQQQGQLARA